MVYSRHIGEPLYKTGPVTIHGKKYTAHCNKCDWTDSGHDSENSAFDAIADHKRLMHKTKMHRANGQMRAD